jgi:hypothetical protein
VCRQQEHIEYFHVFLFFEKLNCVRNRRSHRFHPVLKPIEAQIRSPDFVGDSATLKPCHGPFFPESDGRGGSGRGGQNNFLVLLSCICDLLSLVVEELAVVAEILDCITDIVTKIIASCMIAQTHLEAIIRPPTSPHPAPHPSLPAPFPHALGA